MKKYLLSAVLVAISSAAFAGVGVPIRDGKQCWVTTDNRGFGYWDNCEVYREVIERRNGRLIIHRGITHRPLPVDGGPAGEGGGGSPGGGGNR